MESSNCEVNVFVFEPQITLIKQISQIFHCVRLAGSGNLRNQSHLCNLWFKDTLEFLMPSFLEDHILSALTFLPALGALLLLLLPRPDDVPEPKSATRAATDAAPIPADGKRAAILNAAKVITLINFLLAVALMATFHRVNPSQYTSGPGSQMRYMEVQDWLSIGNVHVAYRMGVDGIGLLLILLTTFLMTLCAVFSSNRTERVKEYIIFLLLLESGIIGIFCALDLILFYVFWEAMLIPMYFLIGIFGNARRGFAAAKFFVFQFGGSILMLVAIAATYQYAGTLNLLELADPLTKASAALHGLNPQILMYLFAAFALAFMVKTPLVPIHTWLPDTIAEAPTVVSVFLSGEVAIYGFVRFCLPLFPEQAQRAAPLFIVLALVGIIYGSIIAAVQTDSYRLIAYSSIAHIGFVILGIFSFTRIGMMGALIQNINHGISAAMLLFIVGMLNDRRRTRQISQFGGLKKVMPNLATMLLIATLSGLAVPFFNGFVGEFTIMQGAWISNGVGFGPTALAATGTILSAVYMLWWFQRLMLGPVTREENLKLPDLNRNDWAVLIPLAGMIFWIGMGSAFWTKRMTAPVNAVISQELEARNLNPHLPMNSAINDQVVPSDEIAPVKRNASDDLPAPAPIVKTEAAPETAPVVKSAAAAPAPAVDTAPKPQKKPSHGNEIAAPFAELPTQTDKAGN